MTLQAFADALCREVSGKLGRKLAVIEGRKFIDFPSGLELDFPGINAEEELSCLAESLAESIGTEITECACPDFPEPGWVEECVQGTCDGLALRVMAVPPLLVPNSQFKDLIRVSILLA